MSPPQSERSRRRAPAACTPCRRRHVRCIWSPTEGSPVRCQRCRERELDCVYEPTAVTMPPPTPPVVPMSVHASSQSMGSGSPPSRGPRHAGTSPTSYQQSFNVLNSFPQRQTGQIDNTYWNSRVVPVGPPYGQSPAQSQGQTPYFGSGSWRPGPQSSTLQSSPYDPNYTVSQLNGITYQSPSESVWSTSPYSTTDPNADSFYNLLSQSPMHQSSQSPPMLDPPSRY